jgi:serine/threonine-protein kinase
VWEGHDDVLARPVAVKILHAHLAGDDGFVERFRREAVAAARLTHPDIVATFDAGTDDRVAYIVMELVRGRTVRQALEADGPFPPAKVVRIAMKVADALDHAHRSGIVHRDVKPANILLADDDATVKVADFGIAKLQEGGDLTQTGAVVGTAKYLSPEQVEGRPPDVRSDIYALGVVCYEMLCGRAPFVADTELATALAHVRSEPEPPRHHQEGVPEPLEAVILKAMARDPEARFQTAADLRVALGSADLDAAPGVDSEPTPPSGVVPVPRSRRRWVPALLVLALVGLVAAVVVTQLPGSRTNQHQRTLSAPATKAVHPISVAEIHSFDPGGDRVEHEERIRFLTDGDPTTTWATDHYTNTHFGTLKDGVGIAVRLNGQQKVGRLSISSPTQGWAAQVYVADAPADDLAGWGKPVDSQTGIHGNIEFDLHGRSGGAVLLWITELGSKNTVEIGELAIEG